MRDRDHKDGGIGNPITLDVAYDKPAAGRVQVRLDPQLAGSAAERSGPHESEGRTGIRRFATGDPAVIDCVQASKTSMRPPAAAVESALAA